MSDLRYQHGFANHFATEALPNTLPIGQNSPQQVAHGLYAEQFSATAFTTPRANTLRSWLYRILPSVVHGEFSAYSDLTVAPLMSVTPPNQMRWSPLAAPNHKVDFIHGWRRMAANTGPWQHCGAAAYIYHCNQSMTEQFFYDADGELLIIPQRGELHCVTEFGHLTVAPKQILVIPRGCKFQVKVTESCSGYVCENKGVPFQLPELGPIGANGLANPRDFEAPVAAFEHKRGDFQLICKFNDSYWQAGLKHSPCDVVAWHGNVYPYRYDLTHFNAVNSVNFDHSDPSIFTVLTSPGLLPGVANIDFVIFPERWVVAEHSFRPPYYHRNVMNEFMGLISGEYDAKGDDFAPGGVSLHNCMSSHGPDAATFAKASQQELKPTYYQNTMAFMLESAQPWQVTEQAFRAKERDNHYQQCWLDIEDHFSP